MFFEVCTPPYYEPYFGQFSSRAEQVLVGFEPSFVKNRARLELSTDCYFLITAEPCLTTSPPSHLLTTSPPSPRGPTISPPDHLLTTFSPADHHLTPTQERALRHPDHPAIHHHPLPAVLPPDIGLQWPTMVHPGGQSYTMVQFGGQSYTVEHHGEPSYTLEHHGGQWSPRPPGSQ